MIPKGSFGPHLPSELVVIVAKQRHSGTKPPCAGLQWCLPFHLKDLLCGFGKGATTSYPLFWLATTVIKPSTKSNLGRSLVCTGCSPLSKEAGTWGRSWSRGHRELPLTSHCLLRPLSYITQDHLWRVSQRWSWDWFPLINQENVQPIAAPTDQFDEGYFPFPGDSKQKPNHTSFKSEVSAIDHLLSSWLK